ncbi:hypothetical protein CWB41_11435 [Methylovirgula ligni]|uniref:Uncharacterized protein (TIGR02594 family) n=1 Tax=Methylovirgula ligni TaxID=569860 RepID=A0A3D9YTU5_9HYPH|nr:TIGR02594 family protein [Methylovirgula ligni]QAY96266.1 hypothetical protein CWB41_11435 [Methylovirgula ligni]REF86027.1 uncharacterized protein (TIGR02594 family) [Methylovirgula ligni]
MGREALCTLAVSAVVGLVTLALEPWTPQWWLGIIIFSGLALYTAVDGGFWQRTRQQHPKLSFFGVIAIIGACAAALYVAGYKREAAAARISVSGLCQTEPPEPWSLVPDAPVWLKVAAQEYGTAECSYPGSNPRVQKYFSAMDDGHLYREDTTDWSSPFVYWALKQAGIEGVKGIYPLAWLNWGRTVSAPQIGDLVILKVDRRIPHVGFWLEDDGDRVRVLGGDENDAVRAYHYQKSDVLGYRRPAAKLGTDF